MPKGRTKSSGLAYQHQSDVAQAALAEPVVAVIDSAGVLQALASQLIAVDASDGSDATRELDIIGKQGWDRQISLCAATAYRLPVASVLMKGWFRPGELSDEAMLEMQTCLHEAVVNALMHGCLSLGSEAHVADHFKTYYQNAEALLERVEYASKRIRIRLGVHSGRWCIQVEDEGKGYNYKQIKQQIHTALTGRGLHLIHHFSHAMIEDGGRKLTMQFNHTPVKGKNRRTNAVNQDDNTPDIRNARLLLVDDNEFSMRLLLEIVGKQGFTQVEIAHDGLEAIEKTLSFRPDIVLLDMMMPKLSGFDYCKQIRATAGFEAMPILVITALSEPMEKVRAFEAGATDLVNKPFAQDELLARIRVHLNNRAFLSSLKEYRQRMADELESARQMQAQLLP